MGNIRKGKIITKAGLAAEAKAPGKRTSLEHKQAKNARRAIQYHKEKEEERLEQIALEKKEASKINMSLIGITNYKGAAKIAYQIKYFWVIEDSNPLQFQSGLVALDIKKYEPLRAIALRLCKYCIKHDTFADRAIWLQCLLNEPPSRKMKYDLMATCRELADLVLAEFRE